MVHPNFGRPFGFALFPGLNDVDDLGIADLFPIIYYVSMDELARRACLSLFHMFVKEGVKASVEICLVLVSIVLNLLELHKYVLLKKHECLSFNLVFLSFLYFIFPFLLLHTKFN